MPIFTLTRRGGREQGAGCYRKIVRADNSNEARRIADREPGAEGHIWTRHEFTSCKKIRVDQGRPYVLCEDHYG